MPKQTAENGNSFRFFNDEAELKALLVDAGFDEQCVEVRREGRGCAIIKARVPTVEEVAAGLAAEEAAEESVEEVEAEAATTEPMAETEAEAVEVVDAVVNETSQMQSSIADSIENLE